MQIKMKRMQPTLSLDPGPTATTVASRTLACAFSGISTPPFVFVSAANLSTKTRSNNGLNLFKAPAF